MRTIDLAQRRARLVRRHRLVRPVDARARVGPVDPVTGAHAVVDLARSMVGLHASDPATPHLAARARLAGFVPAHLDRALYEDRTVTKHLGMRRTLFVQADDVVPLAQAACTGALIADQRRRLIADVEAGGVADDGAEWLDGARADVLAELANGPATGAQLSKRVGAMQAKLVVGEGRRWGGEVGVGTRVYTLLGCEGAIRRGPAGRWTSSQHRWELAAPIYPLPEDEARRHLVEAWLRAFGPATLDDVVWWTGLGKTKVRASLTELDVAEVDVAVAADGSSASGLVLADDLDPEHPAGVDDAAASVALLPGLDPTTMGWKHRGWYLGEHAPRLFDRNGNAGATVWVGGRVVGGWAQRAGGEVVTELLEDVGAEHAAAVESAAEDLAGWLGDVVVTPRFPVPLDRELRA